MDNNFELRFRCLLHVYSMRLGEMDKGKDQDKDIYSGIWCIYCSGWSEIKFKLLVNKVLNPIQMVATGYNRFFLGILNVHSNISV